MSATAYVLLCGQLPIVVCHVPYAAQDDILLPTTTPREALQFAAALRLPTPHYTKQQQAAAVDRLIDGMKLEHCADTMVGCVCHCQFAGGGGGGPGTWDC
jgi:hypothetical protein